ncbi:hypothetical protein BC938DRAFT_471987 [Jimgerdemannia flammicorona]|uniref:Protein kinase domain-containing protein n=1 Tax=Jimgerdemannia flammicorona TaxID=994334 RepID=A0A433Q705_9FUNG|nr:hypothetical protein BC938DRAFT_471987 [Jimgerdemannia flammicorona]
MESTRPQYHTPLAPFDQLDPFRQQRIRHIKSVFSAQETDLRLHLARLSLSELADRLSWIPPELLRDIQQVGRGRFAAVCSAKIKYPTEDRFWENELHGNMFVLKEVEEKMLRELVLSIQLSNMIDTTAPTAVLFGLTYILRTKRYALVMEYSPLGTMEQQPLATTWKDRCWDKDPSARPSAEDVAGFTSFWLYRCKHKDDESPFLPETRAFVAERRAVHLEQSEADGFGSLTSRL